ncbi:MAG: FAD-binding oxidoreductase [Actinomycetota bacterium]|nr:FAD-binding oxidoreductase [Actinomycetota bacterium]
MDQLEIVEALTGIVGAAHVASGAAVRPDDAGDESLTVPAGAPLAVVRPSTTAEVAAVVDLARRHGVPLTPRGSGTGLSGGATPPPGGVVVAFDRMAAILELDTANHVAIVQPGVTLATLDEVLAPLGLVYPVFPGELSASIGGNVATNAGGMRAVKYGVTRHHVLGLELVLGTGEVVRTGGRFVKATSGYDLTQLVLGSEGTLALVTEATLRLHPRPPHSTTVLAPFATVRDVTSAVPAVVSSGTDPMIVEYVDLVSMSGITQNAGIDLGVPDDVRERALAYLVVTLEQHRPERLEEDVEALATLLAELGAIDVYVLPGPAGAALIAARERAFWAAKAAGANDIVDVVVPRASIPDYLEEVGALAAEAGALVIGCGHAGDGNVHLSVFEQDPDACHRLVHAIAAAGVRLGGAVSGEHGIGRAKQDIYLALEDPAKLALMRRLKDAFDPSGVLNPGALLRPEPGARPADRAGHGGTKEASRT